MARLQFGMTENSAGKMTDGATDPRVPGVSDRFFSSMFGSTASPVGGYLAVDLLLNQVVAVRGFCACGLLLLSAVSFPSSC
jgi:hypothetical protein